MFLLGVSKFLQRAKQCRAGKGLWELPDSVKGTETKVHARHSTINTSFKHKWFMHSRESWWMEIKGHNNLWSFVWRLRAVVWVLFHIYKVHVFTWALLLWMQLCLCLEFTQHWHIQYSCSGKSLFLLQGSWKAFWGSVIVFTCDRPGIKPLQHYCIIEPFLSMDISDASSTSKVLYCHYHKNETYKTALDIEKKKCYSHNNNKYSIKSSAINRLKVRAEVSECMNAVVTFQSCLNHNYIWANSAAF